jgi:hypothetical protein
MFCKTEKSGIRVLTDSEALEYKSAQHSQGVKKVFRVFDHMKRIDQGMLTRDEIDEHDKQVIRQSRIVQAVKRERRLIGP